MRRWRILAIGLVVALLGIVLLVLNLGDGPETTGPSVTTEPSVTTTSGPSADAADETASKPSTTHDAAPPSATASETESASAPPSTPDAQWLPPADAEPVAVRVGAAGIDHSLVPQGLSADGTINPARGEVIWFTGYDRVRPGQVGTSVIAGHVTYSDIPDAFINLSSVETGDTIVVDYANGESLTAAVVSTHLVAKEDLSHDPLVWGGNEHTRRIVLITCDDAFGNRSDGHNLANFVVVAEVATPS